MNFTIQLEFPDAIGEIGHVQPMVLLEEVQLPNHDLHFWDVISEYFLLSYTHVNLSMSQKNSRLNSLGPGSYVVQFHWDISPSMRKFDAHCW